MQTYIRGRLSYQKVKQIYWLRNCSTKHFWTQDLNTVTHYYKYKHLVWYNMAKISVTLSLDANVYKKYREYCLQNAIALSRSVEMFMEDQINKSRKK